MRVYSVLSDINIIIVVFITIETKLSEKSIVQHSLERIHPKVVIRLALIFLFFRTLGNNYKRN